MNIVRLPRRRNVLVFSDLQFSAKTPVDRLNFLLRELYLAAKQYRVDYFFFLGDLINSLEDISTSQQRSILVKWLNQVAEIAPLIIIIGNHDYFLKGYLLRDSDAFRQWCDVLRQIPNLHLLGPDQDYCIFDDGTIRVMGLMLPDECYHYPTGKVSKSSAVAAYQKQIKRLLPNLKSIPQRDYYLLLHSPRHINTVPIDPDIFTLAGHSHNGLIPPIIDEIFSFSSRGLVVPGYKVTPTSNIRYELLAPNARIRPKENRLIMTARPCTYLSSSSYLGFFNRFYPCINYDVIMNNSDKSQSFQFTSWYFRTCHCSYSDIK